MEDRWLEELEARHLKPRLDALILDIIHASEYLWEVGTALYGEKGPPRIKWVEAKLYALLEGKVGPSLGDSDSGSPKNKTNSPKRKKKP